MELSVRRIKVLGFYINEGLLRPNAKDIPVKLELALNLSFTIETDLVFLVVRIFYHYPDAPPTDVIADIQVQNVFEVPGLRQFHSSQTEIVLPSDMISTLVGLSITHTRALFAQQVAGTLFQETLPAIVNPSAIAQHFFPNMFAEPTPMQDIIDVAE